MIYPKRRFNIKKCSDVETFATEVTRCTWTLCTGFELHGYLFLNDSISEDGGHEYAVIKDGRQVESITFGWCTRRQAMHHVRDIFEGKHVDMGAVSPRLDHPKGTCHLCS